MQIRKHLDECGSALIPLFLPAETPAGQLGQAREVHDRDGSVLRVTAVEEERDEGRRCQTTLLRYERVQADASTVLERPWVLHWHSQAGFRELAASAGLATRAVLDTDGAPATELAHVFSFLLTTQR